MSSDSALSEVSLPLVEFYIASNPPLTPTGVKQVIESVEACNAEYLIFEILYEPEVPWFKILTFVPWQAEAAALVEGCLSKIVDGSRVVDLPSEDPGTGLRLDIVPAPLLTPWAALSVSPETYELSFDGFKYPKDMKDLTFKDKWKVLVTEPRFTIDSLLAFPSEWHHLGFPADMQALQGLLHCYISHNIAKTTIYLGSSVGQHIITRAVKVLNTLLQCAIAISDHKYHLIHVEDQGDMRFTYKYLTQIGLFKTTYPPLPSSPDEFVRLETAVTIQTASMKNNSWKCDAAKYPSRGELRNDAVKQFSAFKGYRYRDKTASSIAAVMEEAEQLVLKSEDSAKDHASQNSASPSESDSKSSDRSTAPTDNIAHEHDVPDHETPHHPLPGLPSRRDTHSFMESDDLICFDESASSFEKDTSNEPQPSLLDDVLPLEPDVPSRTTSEIATTTTPMRENLDNQSLPNLLHQNTNVLAPGFQHSIVPLRSQQQRKGDKKHPWEAHIKSLVSMAQYAPGHVRIQTKFGRFYMANLRASDVDDGRGPYHKMTDIIDGLEAETLSGNLRYSTILSNIGPDADAIVGASAPIPKWQGSVRDVVYQVECEFEDKGFFVEIDAETFNYTCRGPELEIGSVFVHCPQHAWDFKVCADSSENLDASLIHRTFGKMITTSLNVLTAPDGNKMLDLIADTKLGLSIKGVTIRHVARYFHVAIEDSVLSITMIHKLSPASIKDNRGRWVRRDMPARVDPQSWYEAHISSLEMEKILGENGPVPLGSRSAWSADDLESHSLFFSLYEPAAEMIPDLDRTGQYNDNKQSEAKLHWVDSVAEHHKRNGPKEVFW